MAIVLDGNLGITSPAETVQGALTTTGNTILGDASTDTLNVGNGGLVKDASGNVGIGTASPVSKIHAYGTGQIGTIESSGDYSASGAGFIRYKDSTGNRGYVGFGGTSNLMTISNTLTLGVINFETAGTEQARITAAGLLQFNSGYGSVATAYGCRAWVNFNGTGTVAIRASGNVSSITDNGTADYTVNFTTAMVDANYSVSGACGTSVAGGESVRIQSAPTTASVRVVTSYYATGFDALYTTVSIFR